MRGFKTAIGALRKATGGEATKKKGNVRDGGKGNVRRHNMDDDGGDGDGAYDDLDGDQIIDSI